MSPLRQLARPDRLLLVLPVACALAVSLPMFLHPLAMASADTWRTHDWLESAKLDAFARTALLKWQCLPHWNPLLQGGFPQLAHPSDGSLSPLLLPSLLLGEALGMKVNVVLCLALGAVGTALLGRDRWGLRAPYATFAGCAYAVIGWVPSRVSVGFYESTLFAIFPLLVWLFLHSAGRPWRLLSAAALLAAASMQLQLGLPILLLALALLTAAELARGALPRSHVARFAALGVISLGIAAVKLVPMVRVLAAGDFREIAAYPQDYDAWHGSLGEFGRGLLFTVPFPGSYDEVGFATAPEFGYLGLGLPLLVLAAAIAIKPRAVSGGVWVMLALAVTFAWLGFGPHAPVDLFRPLWSLPVFHSMRGPVRYTSFVVAWAACPVAAAGLQQLARIAMKRAVPPWVIAALAVAALAWPATQSAIRFGTSFTRAVRLSTAPEQPLVQEALRGTHFGQSRGGDDAFDRGNVLKYANLKVGVGTVYRPEDLPVEPRAQGSRIYQVDLRQYVDNPRYSGEVMCGEGDCGAEVVAARANELVVRVDLPGPDRVILNQNYADGWRASYGDAEVEAHDWFGLLAADVQSSGPVEVTFRYRSPGFDLGLAISVATLAGCVALISLRRRLAPRGR
jgi:hypothetical protein